MKQEYEIKLPKFITEWWKNRKKIGGYIFPPKLWPDTKARIPMPTCELPKEGLESLLKKVILTSSPYISTTDKSCMSYILTYKSSSRQFDELCGSEEEAKFYDNVRNIKISMLKAASEI